MFHETKRYSVSDWCERGQHALALIVITRHPRNLLPCVPGRRSQDGRRSLPPTQDAIVRPAQDVGEAPLTHCKKQVRSFQARYAVPSACLSATEQAADSPNLGPIESVYLILKKRLKQHSL